MQEEGKAILALQLAKQVRSMLEEMVPDNSGIIFKQLVKEQPNRGSDFQKWSVDLLNYWSEALNAVFGLRWGCKSLLERANQ
jgi:hypothetical protein